MHFQGMSSDEAKLFAARWLPAWTGNQPEFLASFYALDAVYSDPSVPGGLQGRDSILKYFRKLLAKNPEWIWEHRGSIPIENGFLNRWYASIPVGNITIEAEGVCTVQLCEGLIDANHVFFDRSALVDALSSS